MVASLDRFIKKRVMDLLRASELNGRVLDPKNERSQADFFFLSFLYTQAVNVKFFIKNFNFKL
jgi:hypothetical protein